MDISTGTAEMCRYVIEGRMQETVEGIINLSFSEMKRTGILFLNWFGKEKS